MVIVTALSTIGTTAGAIYSLAKSDSFEFGWVVAAGFCGAIFLSLVVYSFVVRSDNVNLQHIATNFRAINTIYRDALTQCFAGPQPITERDRLIPIERKTVESVCQRIAQIYTTLTGKECLATVKILTREDGKIFASTYARSLTSCDRDLEQPEKFIVNTGANTAFDVALMPDSTGGTPHFYSGELTKHKSYHNERQGYIEHYKSTLVVPIRRPAAGGHPSSDIGFLCIDSRSTNRINNSHHLVMLAALSDQMYNFFSFMRGKYRVNVGEDREAD